MNSYEVYACPKTHQELQLNGKTLQTQSQEIGYDIEGGIPQFIFYKSAETQEIQDTLDRLNQIAETEGWEKALEKIYGADSGMYRYVTDRRRLLSLDLLPLKSESVVLEIGAGLGQFTPEIARRAKMVHALEVVPGQARFVQQRCQQQGANNVQIACGGDDCRLPYASDSFDVVVCNLVLEWCASRNLDQSIVASQEQMLGEIYRVLKGGGVAYIATKNRYSLHYLIGKGDEHCNGMPFGNALPRWLLHLLLRLQGKSRPRGLLHSYSQLKQMLLRAGFESIESFWANPDLRFPTSYIPTDVDSIASARTKKDFAYSSMRSTNLLLGLAPNGLIKHLTQGLVFLGHKPTSKI